MHLLTSNPPQILPVTVRDSRSQNNSHRERQGRPEPQRPPLVLKEHAGPPNSPAAGVFALTPEKSRETLNLYFSL